MTFFEFADKHFGWFVVLAIGAIFTVCEGAYTWRNWRRP